MLKEAKAEGVKKARVHILLDGRDVPATSAPEYIAKLEAVFAELNDNTFDGRIASGGGRMQITMDRYQANWGMVKAGWDVHVHGKSLYKVVNGEGAYFNSAREAIETFRSEQPGVIDQDCPPSSSGRTESPSAPCGTGTASSSSTSAATARWSCPWPLTATPPSTSLTAARFRR